jgi:pyridinium-3,5-bisthiocarboxylic acid mononucleotide nickel chelatase
MRILVFDPFHGAAGDMIVGALIDCGADAETIRKAMQSVVAEPKISRVLRCGISAVKVETYAPIIHRTLEEVMQRLDVAVPHVPPDALAMAKRIFLRINAAEEQVHGAHTHFHEVGADDAIADVIGACTALSTLNVEGVCVFPLALGRGTATGSHGSFPIPAPATIAVLKGSGLTTISGGDEGELCTPTGAALLAEFSSTRPAVPGPFTILSAGYGAGTRDPPHTPNVLRVMVVETQGRGLDAMLSDTIDVLETNVDDVSGEVIAHALTQFMDYGARDASAIPVIMKKGRPGFLIRVICGGDASMRMAQLMARELRTLGIRCTPSVHRFIAERTIEEVEVEIAGQKRTMPVKCGWMNNEIYTLKAEFGNAVDWSAELGIPVREVLSAIEDAARASIRKTR